MNEWLKELLEDAYTEELDTRICGRIAQDFVPKEDYEQLRRESEQTIGMLQAQTEKQEKTAAVRERLRALGAADPDYLIYKEGGIDAFAFDESKNPLGLEQLAERYRNAPQNAWMFSGQQAYTPAAGDSSLVNPFARETFNLTEQGKLLRQNPAEARRLAAAAKIKL